MKKIALVTDKMSVGGGLEHIYQITRYIDSFEFGIFGRKGPGVQKFRDLPHVKIFDEGYHFPYIEKYEPNLIHVHHLKPLLSLYNLPFISPHQPVLFTLHGAHIHKYEFVIGLVNRVKYHLRFNLEKYLFKKADQLITVSKDDHQIIKNRYQLKNVQHIPNGLDLSGKSTTSQKLKDSLRKKLQLPEGAYLFITVARFDFQKGYDILVTAIDHFFKKNPGADAKFIFMGSGPEKPAIQKLISKFNLEDKILLFDSSDRVREFMQASDILISPSRWEGLPYTLLEAGKFKLPVLASDTFGIREIIDHERNGLLFANQSHAALAEIIQQIIAGRYDMNKLVRRLYKDVKERYDSESCMKQLEGLYIKWLQ